MYDWICSFCEKEAQLRRVKKAGEIEYLCGDCLTKEFKGIELNEKKI